MEILKIVDRVSGLISVSSIRSKSEDFFTDRLFYKFTTGVLSLFGFLCGIRTVYSAPIVCWVPAQLRRYEKAIISYCYANNTYFVPEDRRVPSTAEERYDSLIVYYQWLPWIFGVLALIVYSPKIVWKIFLSTSRNNVRFLVETAHRINTAPRCDKGKFFSAEKENEIVELNSNLFETRDAFRLWRKRKFLNRFHSCYLIFCYLIVKLLYLAVCFVEISFINSMIDFRSFSVSRLDATKSTAEKSHFVVEFYRKFNSGLSELIDTSAFPKRTLCDFTFRELASNHAYTVECLLPLNLIAEKMFVFLYVWFIVLAFLTAIDFLRWCGHLIHSLVDNDRSRERYVRSHLIDQTRFNPEDIRAFAHEQLSGNNFFIFKLLSKNISSFVVVDILDYYFRTRASQNKKDN